MDDSVLTLPWLAFGTIIAVAVLCIVSTTDKLENIKARSKTGRYNRYLWNEESD